MRKIAICAAAALLAASTLGASLALAAEMTPPAAGPQPQPVSVAMPAQATPQPAQMAPAPAQRPQTAAQPQPAAPAPQGIGQPQPQAVPVEPPASQGVYAPGGTACPAGKPAAAPGPGPRKALRPVGCAPETSGGPYWNEKTLEPEPFICPQYSYPEKSMRKFGRGVANIVTAPLEIVNQPLNYLYRTESGGVIPGITAVVIGVPAGVGWMVYRLLSGALDVATFPLPFWRPVIKPEFVVNDFQKRQVLQIKSDEEMKQRLAPYRCPADRP